MNPLEVKFSYAWARVIPRSENSRRGYIHGIGCFRSGRSASICLLDRRLALTFLQLPIINGIFNPSSIIIQLPKRTKRRWQEPTIMWQKKIFDDHVDLVFLIWPINHPRCLSFPHCHVFEKCLPHSLLGSLKSLRVTSIMVLKINWSTNNSSNSFHTLVLFGTKL